MDKCKWPSLTCVVRTGTKKRRRIEWRKYKGSFLLKNSSHHEEIYLSIYLSTPILTSNFMTFHSLFTAFLLLFYWLLIHVSHSAALFFTLREFTHTFYLSSLLIALHFTSNIAPNPPAWRLLSSPSPTPVDQQANSDDAPAISTLSYSPRTTEATSADHNSLRRIAPQTALITSLYTKVEFSSSHSISYNHFSYYFFLTLLNKYTLYGY